MADSDKTEHVSESIMERFSMRTLSATELINVARHLTGCPECQAQLVSTLRRQREVGDLSFTLAPEFWIRHEHLDYDQLLEYAERTLDATDRELIDVHLKVCLLCQEDVRSFLAFRKQIAPEIKISYAPVKQEPARERLPWISWWHGLAWKPVYSAALIVIGIALVIGAALLLNRRAENQRAHQPTPQVSPASTSAVASNLPSPTASPNESPSTAEAVVLNDRGRTITIDKSGKAAGLDDLPPSMRNEIAQALLSAKIDRPPILKELGGRDSTLRGSSRDQPFKLLTPRRSVIVSNQPTFRWESIPGASSYTVYINDRSGQITAKSDGLTPDRTDWVSKPLKRGEIYTWTVVAAVDGNEIVSPGPSAPEMKFQVLSAADLAQLNQLKRVRSHLALGIFYVRVGMVVEAEREVEILLQENPRSAAIRDLVIRIRSF